MKASIAICLVSIVLSLIIFFSAFYHYMYLQDTDIAWSGGLAKILSMTSVPELSVPREPAWVDGNSVLTEERAIILAFCAAMGLAVLSVVVSVLTRLNKGRYTLFPGLLLTSITLAITYGVTFINSGLYHFL